ncbi:hypothetical protein RJT34_15224 [Clitoria ternatea]|uniref:Translation initiation factor 3 C-terminal domain-containing protein n=1 Tax=Clitoria ternatea TaxID=43366 RepID=A0AAN9PN11_CLITE
MSSYTSKLSSNLNQLFRLSNLLPSHSPSQPSASVRLIDGNHNMVILSPDADPPVVKMMDYRYSINQHDYSVRLKAARKFLKDGDKVKVIVNLKGRENEFRNIAIELIKRFQSDVGELATEETKSFRDRNIFIVMVPNKGALQKAQDLPKRRVKSEADEVSMVSSHNGIFFVIVE